MKRIGAFICVLVMLSNSLMGCAPSPKNIQAAQVQPQMFSALNCEDLSTKQGEVSSRLTTLSAQQQSAASTDTTLFWVGMFLFWPAWLGWAMTDNHAPEIAQLKGEHDVLNDIYIQRCLAKVDTEQAQPVMEGAK